MYRRWVPLLGLSLLLLGATGSWSQQSTTAQEVTNESDGSTLELIPSGAFRMGASRSEVTEAFEDDSRRTKDPDMTYFENEIPDHQVQLGDYYLGKTPVTNSQFERFVKATGYRTDAERIGWGYAWIQHVGFEPVQGASWRTPDGPNSSIRVTQPVVGVSWNDASAYCRWAGVRLPTEAEWEKAARGTDGRQFPWGQEWDPTRLCRSAKRGGDVGAPADVGSFPTGTSPYGCLDMAGEVWQWTDSWFDAYSSDSPANADYGTKYRVLRGGSWISFVPANFRSAMRGKGKVNDRSDDGGFRVAKSP